MPSVTFKKLRSGDWGIRAEGVTLAEGSTVWVTRRNGRQKPEVVGRIVYGPNAAGVSLATIAESPDAAKPDAVPVEEPPGAIDLSEPAPRSDPLLVPESAGPVEKAALLRTAKELGAAARALAAESTPATKQALSRAAVAYAKALAAASGPEEG